VTKEMENLDSWNMSSFQVPGELLETITREHQ
jgi:hypothetical protein